MLVDRFAPFRAMPGIGEGRGILQGVNQVRDYMNGLSTKIGETTRGPIRRWP